METIEARLKELEFKPGKEFVESGGLDLQLQKAGWSLYKFERQEDGNQPKIGLSLREHKRYGINITFTSIPPNDSYIFSTRSPVNEGRAIGLINRYMESVRKGERFRD